MEHEIEALRARIPAAEREPVTWEGCRDWSTLQEERAARRAAARRPQVRPRACGAGRGGPGRVCVCVCVRVWVRACARACARVGCAFVCARRPCERVASGRRCVFGSMGRAGPGPASRSGRPARGEPGRAEARGARGGLGDGHGNVPGGGGLASETRML